MAELNQRQKYTIGVLTEGKVNCCFLKNAAKKCKSVRSHLKTDFFFFLPSTVVKRGFRKGVRKLHSLILATTASQQNSVQHSADGPFPTWEGFGFPSKRHSMYQVSAMVSAEQKPSLFFPPWFPLVYSYCFSFCWLTVLITRPSEWKKVSQQK